MKRLILIAIFLLTAPALAQEPVAEPEKAPETRIEVDEEASEIRFIIDGVEQARLTSDGLHIRRNIKYGGTMADTGVEAFEERKQESK